jgi:glycosyltransferase involved in cell wall biosynthesis
MSNPLFSILIPSRNRLELICHALESISIQNFDDYEIIVSDNASDTPYKDRIASAFPGLPLRVLRSEEPLAVTENWNRALDDARGRYIIMLGDDDALTPGCLHRLSELISRFSEPDLLYQMAHHYAYPGVFPDHPNGFFCEVRNSSLFETKAPFELNPALARDLGRRAMNFRHDISFNAQHYVWKREYIHRCGVRPFFQSSYPDYFASFVTFLTAARIVVVPSPEVIIGIAKQSFGFFHFNKRDQEGYAGFLNDRLNDPALAKEQRRAHRFQGYPGSGIMHNWLVAALMARRALAKLGRTAPVGLKRYRMMHMRELARRAGFPDKFDRAKFLDEISALEWRERLRARFLLVMLERTETTAWAQGISDALSEPDDVHYPAILSAHDIGPHENIMDAVRWLERQSENHAHAKH